MYRQEPKGLVRTISCRLGHLCVSPIVSVGFGSSAQHGTFGCGDDGSEDKDTSDADASSETADTDFTTESDEASESDATTTTNDTSDTDDAAEDAGDSVANAPDSDVIDVTLYVDASVARDGAVTGDATATSDVSGDAGTGDTTSTSNATATSDVSDDAGTGDASSPEVPVEPTVLVPFGVTQAIGSPGHIEVDGEYVYWTGAWVEAEPGRTSAKPHRLVSATGSQGRRRRLGAVRAHELHQPSLRHGRPEPLCVRGSGRSHHHHHPSAEGW